VRILEKKRRGGFSKRGQEITGGNGVSLKKEKGETNREPWKVPEKV